MRILSIQSTVAYGHVGNSAAVFPLQRLGHEVMPVPTVCFSNHTGYGSWQGPLLSGDDVRQIVTGIDERGGFNDCSLVLSGYQGGSSIGGAILDAVAQVKERNPKAVYACDPVLGNAKSGCFVSNEVQELIRDRVIQHADILTPNQFELSFLTGITASDLDSTLAAVRKIQDLGPKTILVTSVVRPEADPEMLEMLAVSCDQAYVIATPRLPFKANGSGDVTAALFATHLTAGNALPEALEKTTNSVYQLLQNTYSAQSRELLLIESQEAYVNPEYNFTANKLF